jgi:hypothetical protein
MGWMRFDHSESDLLAADWTRIVDDVLNPHVTSSARHQGEGDGSPNGCNKKVELNPVALQWRHGRIKGCSFNVTVSRREMRIRLALSR